GPPAVGFGFVTVDVNHRSTRFQLGPAIEGSTKPGTIRFSTPVNRVVGAGAFPPAPSRLAPQLRPPIRAIVHKTGELRLAHCRLRNPEGPDIDKMPPQLIVECEPCQIRSAKHKTSAWHECIAVDRFCLTNLVRRQADMRCKRRSPIAVCLASVSDRLGVHLFVKER